jgi:hypothetical protein
VRHRFRARCGTLYRDVEAGTLALVLHSIEQPPPPPLGARAPAAADEVKRDDGGAAAATAEAEEEASSSWRAFYAREVPHARIVALGAPAVAARLRRLTARPRTLALRDHFAGWAAAGQQAHGGKPLLLDVRTPSRAAPAGNDATGTRLQASSCVVATREIAPVVECVWPSWVEPPCRPTGLRACV